MAPKDEQHTILSDEGNTQLQHVLEGQQELTQQLHNSSTQAQAETALHDITSLPEDVQMALLKTLARTHTLDSADILTAINAFSPNKEIRKEARRSLLRLDAAKIHSRWTPPIAQTAAIEVKVAHAPRFWKGSVTRSRDQGEVQLLLFWEQGYDYSEVRILGFLLDYWREGVKDVFVETVSKRAAEGRVADMHTRMPEVIVVDCTLAEGKRLLEEALEVNTWRHIEPHQDYRNRLPTINQLIFQAKDIGEDRGTTFIAPELEDQETIVHFIGAWSLGDYGLAYDLLTEGSNIRNGLSRDEWIERHRAWYDEAQPARLELGFVHERERAQSALWVPTSPIRNASSRKEIEFGWSIEITDTPLGGSLRELPMGTTINKETKRHWYWANYTVEHTRDGWRIQQFSDEGAAVQGLPITELQKRIDEHDNAINTLVEQRHDDINAALQELTWRATQQLHLYDALIVKLPLDRQVNQRAYERAVFIANPERSTVYLQRLIQRFPDNKGDLMRTLGATFAGLAYHFGDQGMTERKTLFLASAEETLQESLTVQDTATGHMLLGELYLSMGRNEEAEREFLTAKSMTMTQEEEASIESGLGTIELRCEQLAAAIPHYLRVIELAPNYTGIWFSLGFAYRQTGNFVEAEQAYKRGIEIEPTDIRPYSELTAIYMNRPDHKLARAILIQGLQANPESAHLHALYASVLMEIGDMRHAQRELQKAESIDPTLEIVQRVREFMSERTKKR